jgi:iron complex outermembrane receptor protein
VTVPRALIYVCPLLCEATPLLAQVPSGSVKGTVKDSSEAVVPDAEVTLKSAAGAAVKTTLSDAAGAFTLSDLPVGAYSLSVTAKGFQPFNLDAVMVNGSQPTNVSVPLALAKSSSRVDVNAQADPFEIVPDAPSKSVFGLDLPIVDTPRSISVVDADTVARYNIQTVNDLALVSSGTFTGSYFGIPGTLFVRGDESDNYFRGFRRAENEGSYSTPLGAAETIEVVKGPPPTPYGAGKSGGFLNFIPKSARSSTAKWLEHPEGKVTLTYGSYSQKIGALDFGSPLTIGGKRAGIYAYSDFEDSSSYYHYIHKREKLGQIAFDSELGHKWRLEMGYQVYKGNLPQNVGWNRLTQALIDHGTYQAGTPLVNLSTNGYNITPANVQRDTLQTFVFTPNFAPIFLSPDNAQVAALYALNPATMHLAHLNDNQIIADAGDFSGAATDTGYFDIVRDIREGVSFKNQTFVETLDANKYTDYEFSSYYNPKVFENKTTFDYELKPTRWLTAETTSGFAVRHTNFTSGESRTPEENDRRDLSIGPTDNDRFAGAFTSYAINSWDYYQKGTYSDIGEFFLTDIKLWSRLSILGGVRYDYYNPESTGTDSGEPMTHTSGTSGATTYNVSASYRLPHQIVPYFTYATSQYLSVGQGGEVDYSTIPNKSYIQASHLSEAGVKMALGAKFLGTLALFQQKRASYNTLSSTVDYYQTKGVELELRAAPSRYVSFTSAYTFQQPEQLNIPFELGIPGTLIGLTPQESYGGRFIGDASIFGLKVPVEVAGQPKNVASEFVTLTPKRNWGVTVGSSWTQSVEAGYISGVILPSYAVFRGSVFYRYKRYEANLAANNIGDKRYFTSQYLFWDTFVKPSEMRTLSLTVSYRFGRDIQ